MSEDIIRKTYYNPDEGFVGIDKLYRKLKSSGVTKDEIKAFLKKQEVYQVNKKNNKKSASWLPRFPMQEFQIDLIYLDDTHLNKAAYGLCVIDAFSKRADVELMKKRTSGATVDAMMNVLDRMGVPDSFYCDEGSEFNNAAFKRLCDELGIHLIFTIRHAPIVERFNRTVKEMLSKYLQSTNSKTIVNVLPKIVANYNNSFHSSIGMAPSEVNKDTMHIAQINLIKRSTIVPYYSFEVGDRVRVQVKPKSFVKGYKPKFSKTIYEVTEKGKGYYLTTKDDRKYLRSNLQKVTEAEENPEAPELEDTREGQLRRMARERSERVHSGDDMESVADIEPNVRSVRSRKPVSYAEDVKYGRIKW